MNIFVTGTESNIGKTFIISALASIMQSLCYKTAVYKPIQCGAFEQNGFKIAPDISYIKKIDPYVTTECTYLLKGMMSPVIAAEMENVKINPKVILKDYTMLQKKHDSIIVEGTGGLLTPIAPRFTMANLAKMLNIPVVIIAKADLESVNHTLLTVNHAQVMGLKVNGVILNKYPENNEDIALKTIPRLFEEYSDTTVVGVVKQMEGNFRITPPAIIDSVLNGVDIEKIFDIKIPKLEV